MKNKREIQENQGILSPEEVNNLEHLGEELSIFIENSEVTEDGLVILENILASFLNFKRNYGQRVIRLLKQGHMLD